eukprot:4684493-Prymnesium_polylepis.1
MGGVGMLQGGMRRLTSAVRVHNNNKDGEQQYANVKETLVEQLTRRLADSGKVSSTPILNAI